jgi:hypothetical protein
VVVKSESVIENGVAGSGGNVFADGKELMAGSHPVIALSVTDSTLFKGMQLSLSHTFLLCLFAASPCFHHFDRET